MTDTSSKPSQPPAILPKLLTLDDIVEFTQVPKSTIYSMRSAGHGPSGFRIGKSLRFRPQDVEMWLESLRDKGAAA